ncbi:hypothetical protein BUALT_Bualt01G0083600 [Buddleja alternifolia]|uniref:RNase H type-1 domain-containing protein n=1 Tax=Buddleja alternifolia TaxID=168488 RepID=A0AAV6Y9J5_9LAMI|nr:hypothetical protein BUALT_Bualt01G0083600 [Buddleja alternifolia]
MYCGKGESIPNHISGDNGEGYLERDANGQCLAWKRNYRGFRLGQEAAEAFAAYDAMLLARNRGWRHVQLEGDCLPLINKLKAKLVDLSPIGNEPAHILARSAWEQLEGDTILPPQALSAFLSDSI